MTHHKEEHLAIRVLKPDYKGGGEVTITGDFKQRPQGHLPVGLQGALGIRYGVSWVLQVFDSNFVGLLHLILALLAKRAGLGGWTSEHKVQWLTVP